MSGFCPSVCVFNLLRPLHAHLWQIVVALAATAASAFFWVKKRRAPAPTAPQTEETARIDQYSACPSLTAPLPFHRASAINVCVGACRVSGMP